MPVRLAFSVMVQVDADILLIDEVLAVGDVAFQQKCFDVFNRLRDEGKTILFVTHDMAAVRRFCHRALLIERGEVVRTGDPAEVAASYVDLSFREGDDASPEGNYEASGDGSAVLMDAWWEDEHGERQTVVHQGREYSFHARVRFDETIENPGIATLFENEAGQPLMATSTDRLGGTGAFAQGTEVEFSVHIDMVFAPGRLYASPWVLHPGGFRVMHRRPRMHSVVVAGAHVSGGLVDIPHEVRLTSADHVLQVNARP
jgi:hypothetical protein